MTRLNKGCIILYGEDMNWILLALCSAVCTSLTTILAKIGIKNVNSNFATAYRTCIVLLCSLVMCAITGNIARIGDVSGKNILFLALSGIYISYIILSMVFIMRMWNAVGSAAYVVIVNL